MNKFSKDDRVVVYATLLGVPCRSKGTIIEVHEDRLRIKMDKVVTSAFIFAHPMQCRKLKPKSKNHRKIFIAKSDIENFFKDKYLSCDGIIICKHTDHLPGGGDCIEFQETKLIKTEKNR